MKIGGITGWISAMAQAEAAALPLSNHTFVEPSSHVMAVSPTASWFEYLDIAGAVLTERLLPVDGMVTARGPGLGLAAVRRSGACGCGFLAGAGGRRAVRVASRRAGRRRARAAKECQAAGRDDCRERCQRREHRQNAALKTKLHRQIRIT